MDWTITVCLPPAGEILVYRTTYPPCQPRSRASDPTSELFFALLSARVNPGGRSTGARARSARTGPAAGETPLVTGTVPGGLRYSRQPGQQNR